MLEFDLTAQPPSTRTIEQIEGEIIILRDQVARNSIEIGRKLIEAKAMVPAGRWQEWVENNIQFSYRTAARLMQVAERFGDVPALAGIEATKVYALMALPDDQVEGFVAGHDLAGMTSREVEAAVKAQKAAEARAQQLAIELENAKAKAKAEREEAVTAAVKGGEEMLREALGEKLDALKKAKELERKLKELQDTDKKSGEAAAALAQAHARVRELEEQLQAAARPEIVQQEVEKVPDDVAAELEKLRRIAKSAPSAAIIKLRYAYEQWKTGFEALAALIDEAEAEQPSVGPLYRDAIRKALDKMAGQLDGVNGTGAA